MACEKAEAKPEAAPLDRNELRFSAQEIWRKALRGSELDARERGLMREAYWAGVLPSDPDYSVAQWIEDGFPGF